MKSKNIKYTLLYIWVSSFVLSLLFVVINLKYLDSDYCPGCFLTLLNEIAQTYGPQIVTMLAFIFADKNLVRKLNDNNIGYLAIVLSSLYCIFFLAFLLLSHFDYGTFKDIAKVEVYFHQFRPILSILVSASIAYFFVEKKE